MPPESGPLVEAIQTEGVLLATIVRASFQADGIQFLTPSDFSQQLAYMHRPAGHVIEAHVHNPVSREVHYTQEVLFVRRGRLRIDFYNEHQHYLESRVLETGDVILLARGGHGFEMLEDTDLIEVKQGPYVGEGDKTRFAGIRGSARR
jgi:mannose-6-phosphate isomerase-like protein (cupin superfamily)